MKKKAIRNQVFVLTTKVEGLERDTAELVEYQRELELENYRLNKKLSSVETGWIESSPPEWIAELEKENTILKAKVAFCHDNWPGFIALEDTMGETRKSYVERIRQDMGIENADTSHMKFLEDYLPSPLDTDTLIAKRYPPVHYDCNIDTSGWAKIQEATSQNLRDITEETLLRKWDELQGIE